MSSLKAGQLYVLQNRINQMIFCLPLEISDTKTFGISMCANTNDVNSDGDRYWVWNSIGRLRNTHVPYDGNDKDDIIKLMKMMAL